MKSLIKRLIAWSRDQQDAETARIAETVAFHRPPPPPPPPPPQEISCFVKGLIHSMRTEPQNWERKHLFNFYWTCRGVILHESDKEPYYCPNSPLSKSDSRLLAAAIQEYLIRPMNQQEKRKEDQEEAEKRAHFEKLGCPEKTP